MTKSVVSCESGHIYRKNPEWKTSFLCNEKSDIDSFSQKYWLEYSSRIFFDFCFNNFFPVKGQWNNDLNMLKRLQNSFLFCFNKIIHKNLSSKI